MTTDGGGPDPGRAAPDLVLGPLLRYVAETEATIRVETDRASWFHNMLAELEFSGRRARIRWDRTVSDQGGLPHLQAVCEADLS